MKHITAMDLGGLPPRTRVLIDVDRQTHEVRPLFECLDCGFLALALTTMAEHQQPELLAKNPMGAGRPLGGDPIAWPGKDHAQGLAYLLERALPGDQAAAVVARHGATWFRPGLRVFFVMLGTPQDLAAVPGATAVTGALRIASLE